MKRHILKKTVPPAEQARLAVKEIATWYTWSDEFRSLFGAWNREVSRLCAPRPLRLLGGTEYDNTFTLSLDSLSNKVLAQELMDFSESLYRLRIGPGIILLDRMLGASLDGKSLHYLLAVLRAALVRITGDPLSAIHQPLHREYKRPRDFPLHADLYVPRVLLNIFEEVPRDKSGATNLLSARDFLRIVRATRSIDSRTRARIRTILTGTHCQDMYSEFYSLLYDNENAWKMELEERMASEQLTIKLFPGQGYLIDDRCWLHGRGLPSTGITRRRIHRLIFNTADQQKALAQ